MKRNGWAGTIPAWGKKGHFVPAHPLREIDEFFADLSDIGRAKALNLKFGPERAHGSTESLRAYPRGLPGQGSASRLPRPELLRRIQALKVHVGVKQYV